MNWFELSVKVGADESVPVSSPTIYSPYLRITPGHYANIAEKGTLFKDREPPKTIPYSAARTYIAHIGEYPPPPRGMRWY